MCQNVCLLPQARIAAGTLIPEREFGTASADRAGGPPRRFGRRIKNGRLWDGGPSPVWWPRRPGPVGWGAIVCSGPAPAPGLLPGLMINVIAGRTGREIGEDAQVGDINPGKTTG